MTRPCLDDYLDAPEEYEHGRSSARLSLAIFIGLMLFLVLWARALLCAFDWWQSMFAS